MTDEEGIVVAGNIGYGSGNGDGIFIYRLNSEGEFGKIINSTSTQAFPTFNFKVYPNPTTDKITIQNTGTTADQYFIRLYDIKAQQIKNTVLTSDQVELNLQDLPAASYLLEIRNDKNQAYRKLIVKE